MAQPEKVACVRHIAVSGRIVGWTNQVSDEIVHEYFAPTLKMLDNGVLLSPLV